MFRGIETEVFSAADERERLTERLRQLLQEDRRTYLLADTAEDLARVHDFLEERSAPLNIVGEYAFSSCGDDQERIVNDINAQMPEVILSVIDAPEREQFLRERGAMLAVKQWIGLDDFEKLHKKFGFFSSLFRHFALK